MQSSNNAEERKTFRRQDRLHLACTLLLVRLFLDMALYNFFLFGDSACAGYKELK